VQASAPGPGLQQLRRAAAALRLAGHYGSSVEIDLCAPCHLVWFDVVESARLAGPGLLALIGEMAAAQALAHQPLRPDLACPHCRTAVRTVHNRTRWGRSLQLECPQRHGAWQSFGQFLNEKGLLRPMSSADRTRALQAPAGLHCVNCGGALGAADSNCPWCESVPALVDVARLAHALDPEGATAAMPCTAPTAGTPRWPAWPAAHRWRRPRLALRAMRRHAGRARAGAGASTDQRAWARRWTPTRANRRRTS
jgi:Zn-finger nucleic acid-binding protein